MSIDLVVVRDEGDKQGSDIVERVLSDALVAIERGTTEINDNESVLSVKLTTNYRSGVRKGMLVKVYDDLQGSVWVGKIVGITHAVRGSDIWTDLDIERPVRF